jgi:regulator of sigma E protease
MVEFKRLEVGEAFVTGWVATWTILKHTAESIGGLFVGRGSVKDLAGPVGIAKMTGETARQGAGDLFELLALISVNIGFLNILPIPALDGGHLVMVLIEGVRRRPLSTKLKLSIQQVGMLLLLALIAVVVFNDFMRLR